MGTRVSHWTPPARPEWLARVNEEGQGMDIASLVPLVPAELMETAKRNTGLADFGSDEWREPFEIFVKALNEEAELNLFGRLMTRSDILVWLQERLEIEETYRRHPEIDEQELAPPVFITGLPRSGTSILFETLSRDRQFGAPANWEIMFPCPPPEATTYATDPRITKAEHLLGQWNRVTPTFPALHEIGARIPHECAVAMCCTFASDTLPVSYQIPGYYTWLLGADLTPAYAYYRRMLKLLQWRNPRRHWLLKSPAHTQYLPVLFAVFPEATVVLTHRDPIRAQASVTSLIGTMYWMRSDKPFDAASFERLLTPEAIAAGLEHVIGQIESGTVPRDRIHDFQFADLLADPATALAALYGRLGLALDESARAAMAAYLAAKPKGKFGIHSYDIGDPARIARERKIFHRYQQYHHVPNET